MNNHFENSKDKMIQLSNEELVILIQKNIDVKENLSLLYQNNKRFIFTYVKSYMFLVDAEDLMQESFFGLKNAVDLYDVNKNTKFLTYASYWLKLCLKRYVEKVYPVIHLSSDIQHKLYIHSKEINLGNTEGKETSSQLKKLFYETKQYYSLNKIHDIHDNLSEQLFIRVENKLLNEVLWKAIKRVINNKMGYDLLLKLYKRNYTETQCAKIYKVSVSYICQKQAYLLEKLRQSDSIKELAQYYGT